MADISDVRQAIANLISTAVYPNGPLYGPSTVSGAGPIMIVPGYPKSVDIGPSFVYPFASAGQNGVVVAAYDQPGVSRTTTRFPQRSIFVSRPDPTLSWSTSGNTATLSGTISVPQNVALILNGRDHAVYSVRPTDTIPTILAGVAAAIPAAYSATIVGSTIAVTGAYAVIGRIGVVSNRIRPVSQTMQDFCVGIWAAQESVRSAVSKVIKPVLDYQKRLAFADGSAANIFSGREVTVPATTKLGLAQSRILYSVEYSTVLIETAPQAIVLQSAIQSPGGVPFITSEA